MYHNPILYYKWYCDKHLHIHLCTSVLREKFLEVKLLSEKDNHLKSLYECFSKLSSKGEQGKNYPWDVPRPQDQAFLPATHSLAIYSTCNVTAC